MRIACLGGGPAGLYFAISMKLHDPSHEIVVIERNRADDTFGWGVVLAAVLYVIDHIFFGLALALKTYFQKIADPADIAPTAAVAFTINHIAAVFLPFLLGYLWMVSPGAVFGLAAGMALISLSLALLIPRHPVPGNETVFTTALPAPAE